MNITKEFENGKLTAYIEGKLDTSTAPQAAQELEAEIGNIDALVLEAYDKSRISDRKAYRHERDAVEEVLEEVFHGKSHTGC